jgi:hypothetical protein
MLAARCFMASLDPKFHQETVSIHDEHEELTARLDQLDATLEQIVCYSEIVTDLATASRAMTQGKWIAEFLPKHYLHEETTVLETIARMSPDLAAFAQEMRRQHDDLRERLEKFHRHLSHLHENRDIEAAVVELKQEGKDLTRMMRLHMAVEDKKLSGLDN